MKDAEAWRPLLEEAEKKIANQSAVFANIPPTSPFFEKVRLLVPWEIQRIQIYKVPKSRRYVEGCKHRGVVMWAKDCKIEIETEDMSVVAMHPREKFSKPLKFGIQKN